jgi:hypothetical protein
MKDESENGLGRIPCGVAPFWGSPIGSVLRTLPYGQALQAACAGGIVFAAFSV